MAEFAATNVGLMSEAETLRARICAAILRTHQEIVEVFELWDENGDGTVSRVEFTRGVSRVRHPARRFARAHHPTVTARAAAHRAAGQEA